MLKQVKILVLFVAVSTLVAAAQSTVTTSGGTAGMVPVFTGSSDVENSVITQSGSNIGIGTTSPQAKLDVTADQDGIRLSRGFTLNTSFSKLSFSGAGVAGDAASIQSYRVSDAYYGNEGDLRFYTNTGSAGASSNGLEAMRITSTGQVGIGTTSPSTLLQVGSTGATTGQISIPGVYNFENVYLGQTGNGDSDLEFVNHTSYSSSYGVRLLADVDTGVAGLQFQVAPSSTSYTGLSYSTAMTISAAGGNIGIGTTYPGAKLEVDGNIKLTAGSGASVTYADGTVQSTAWNGTLTGGDYAESVDVTGDRAKYEPGDVLVVDPDHDGYFLKASEPYSLAVTGVYSTRPGVVGRRQKIDKALATSEVPMAMVGIVPIKVSAENGPIKRGDPLVTSSTSGYAMKGTDRGLLAGAVIGKALGSLNAGMGVIEAVISLQ